MTFADYLSEHGEALLNTVGIFASIVVSARNASKIQDVHVSLNSRLSQLVAASVDSGRQQERNEQAKAS